MSEELKHEKKNAIRILDYWFTMEFLNQQNLGYFIEKGNKASKYKRELTAGNIRKPNKFVEDFVRFKDGDSLQTVLESVPQELKNFHCSYFTVFIGCMKKETCIQKIAKNIKWNGQSPDANNDEIALAVLKFSQYGR